MMINPRYTSTVTNQPFLLQETLTLAKARRAGKDWPALKQAVEEDNIFNLRSQATRSNVFKGVSVRLKKATPDLLNLLLDSPPDTAKLSNFFLCLLQFRLLRETMAELIQPQMKRGLKELSPFEVDEFFARKRQQQDTLHRWQDSTFERVKGNTLRLAIDAELLIGPAHGPWQMQRPLLSPAFVNTLKSMRCEAFIQLIGTTP